MQQYEIEIKNEKKKSYRLFNWFALVISLAGFSFLLFFDDWFVEALGAMILVCVYLLTRMYRLKKNKALYLFDDNGYLFFIVGLGWLGLQNYLLTGLCLVLGIVYQMAMQKIIFLFKKEGIFKTNFPRRGIEWDSLENVVLKDTILTIDFKNNRIIQGEINSSKEMDEPSFNRFVQSQINAQAASSELSGE